MSTPVRIRRLGLTSYAPVWRAMQAFTDTRTDESADELWLTEHHPVFTQGLAGKAEHILDPGPIPVVASNRGGQVTYHGPGQVVIYTLIDLRRAGIGIREWVSALEDCVAGWLCDNGLAAHARADAPGVYLADGAKIASLGLKVSRGRCYHGIAVNIAMDLEPFSRINPCGHPGLAVTCARERGLAIAPEQAGLALVHRLLESRSWHGENADAAPPALSEAQPHAVHPA